LSLSEDEGSSELHSRRVLRSLHWKQPQAKSFEPAILCTDYMLRGMREKFVAKGGLRDSVWAKLQPPPRDVIHSVIMDALGPAVGGVWDEC
jgi:hypothetical protein